MSPQPPPAPTDGELLARVAAGDDGAFETLYARHAASVMAFAFHLTWDRAAAEEATQQTFVKVWRAAGRFRAGAPFEPWLYRIARNEAFGTRARRRPRGTAAVPVEEASVSAAPDARAREDELGTALRVAIAGLSPRLRLAFVLVRLEGRSQEEAARLLGVPVGTVKSRVAAAQDALRRALARFA